MFRAFLFLLIVCSFITLAGYPIWREAEEAAKQSCHLSLHTALVKSINGNEALSKAIHPGQKWRILSESEVQSLFASVGDKNQFDCGNYPNHKSGRNENGNSLRVAVRQNDGVIYVTVEGTGIDQEPFQVHQPIE